MQHSKPYQYEIVIPIKLRIPIYIEPVAIDASSVSTLSPESINTASYSKTDALVIQDLTTNSPSSTVKLSPYIQPKSVAQELVLSYPSQSAHLSGTAVQMSLNLNLSRALHGLQSRETSLCPRPIWLLAAALTSAVISVVLMQVFSWPVSQTCPVLSRESLPQVDLEAGYSALFCSVPGDENITKLSQL